MEKDFCSICLSNIDAQYMKLAPCGHIFHYNCIMEYINTYGHLQCPLCRQTIKLVECETNIEFTFIVKNYNEHIEYKTKRPFVSSNVLKNIFIETYPIYRIADFDWNIELRENGELKDIFDCFKKEKCMIIFTCKDGSIGLRKNEELKNMTDYSEKEKSIINENESCKYYRFLQKDKMAEICMEAVKRNGLGLQYIKDKTSEICMEAVKRNAHS